MSPFTSQAVARAERDTWSSFRRHLAWGVGLLLLAMLGGWLVVSAFSLHGPLVDLHDGVPLSAGREPRPQQLRLGVAPLYSPQASFLRYQALVADLARGVQQSTTLCLKPSNRAIREDLLNGTLDVAMVSPGTCAQLLGRPEVELLAMPELPPGRHDGCVIVVTARSTRTTLADLRGARFAYTDSEAFNGCVLPRATLAARGWVEESFFSEITFTGADDRSIQSVANGYFDGAAVSALVLENMERQHPELVSRLREIYRSAPVPPPPVLVPSSLDPKLKERLRHTLYTLHETDAGRRQLAELGITRFVPGVAAVYAPLAQYYSPAVPPPALAPPGGPGTP